MTVYALSPAANASVDEIFAYTLEQWGQDQARLYLETLFGTFEAIADGTARSRDAKPAFGFEALFVRVSATVGTGLAARTCGESKD